MARPRRGREIWCLGITTACFALSLPVCLGSKSLEGCGNKQVAVLDLDVMFRDEAEGRPGCYSLTLLVTPSNGRVYIANNVTKDVLPHMAGAHALAWHVAENLKKSDNYTPHLDQADVIFVNDYCYWAWWLAWLNFGTITSVRTNVDDRTPGDFLVSAYGKMMQMPRWQASKGADFVFVDGHPGFYEGGAKHQIWPLRCGALQNSIQIVVGMPQRRRCSGFAEMRGRLIVAPLMAPIVDPYDEEAYTADLNVFWERAKAEAEKQSVPVPLSERQIFLHFKGRCDPHTKNHAGRLMRSKFAREVFNDAGEDVQVSCLEDEVGHAELLEVAASYGEMRHAIFCLMLPGQDQATSAVAEAFLSGCIPVFVGRPWHAIPFAHTVAYNTSALFFKVEDTSGFLDHEAGADADAHVGAHPQEAQMWTLDLPPEVLQKILVTIRSAGDVLKHLRNLALDKQALENRAQAVWDQRDKFLYHSLDGNIPGGAQTLMQEVCLRSRGRLRVDWAEGQKTSSTEPRKRDVSKSAKQARAMQRLLGRNF